MKIDELRKEVESLGRIYDVKLNVREADDYIYIDSCNNKYGISLAWIGAKQMYIISTNNYNFTLLAAGLKNELLDLLVQFAKTPTDKREEEKKYEYRLKEKYLWINDKLNLGNCYLNFEFSQEGGRGDVVLDSRGNTDSFKTEFTDGEIKEIVDMLYIDLEMFDKFEVK